jgi:hypothetical protein
MARVFVLNSSERSDGAADEATFFTKPWSIGSVLVIAKIIRPTSYQEVNAKGVQPARLQPSCNSALDRGVEAMRRAV